MTTATLLRQLRILEIIILCFLIKYGEGKSLKTQQGENERIKRGYSHYGGNDFGSSVHVSSGVLQYASVDDLSHNLDSSSDLDASALSAAHSSGLDSSSHFHTSSVATGDSSDFDPLSHLDSSATNSNPWSAGGHSSGLDVWLEPLPDYHPSSGIDTSSIHTSSIADTHPGSDHITNSVFSGASAHLAHLQLPSSDLHTQISSSSSSANIGGSIHDHGAVAISDNIDFGNVSDVNGKHYSKSYGK